MLQVRFGHNVFLRRLCRHRALMSGEVIEKHPCVCAGPTVGQFLAWRHPRGGCPAADGGDGRPAAVADQRPATIAVLRRSPGLCRRQHKTPGQTVLSDAAGLSVRLGATSWVDDMFVFGEMARRGLVDDHELVQAVQRQDFFAIVMCVPCWWTTALTSAIDRQYHAVGQADASVLTPYVIYLPRNNAKNGAKNKGVGEE